MDERPLNEDAVARTMAWAVPARAPLNGGSVRLEPLDPAAHGEGLFAASHGSAEHEAVWRYMSIGPFGDRGSFQSWLAECAAAADPLAFAIRDLDTDSMMGMASFMRMTPAHGVIEIGFIWFGPEFQRSRQSTEALFLMMDHAMTALGYRRLEWKCNALNEKSRAAALRLGFWFEGVFHQHQVTKGHNRDTAWYSIIDGEWPTLRVAFQTWLAPANFDADGRQRQSLRDLRAG